MNGMAFQQMYGSTPEGFRVRMEDTLNRLGAQSAAAKTPRMPMRRGLRVALVTALVMALLAAVAVAALHSQVAEYFGWLYGDGKREELSEGKIAQPLSSVQMGDAVYTLDEVVYIDDGLYGVGRITPASDGVVLVAEDYLPTEAAGYGLHYGEESQAPDGAPTSAEVAAKKNAKLLQVHAAPEAVGVDEGDVLMLGSIGYSLLPQLDGSVVFAFEIPTGIAVEEGDEYLIRLWVSSWELLPDGTWLRDDPAQPETYVGQEWDVTVRPVPAKEGEWQW